MVLCRDCKAAVAVVAKCGWAIGVRTQGSNFCCRDGNVYPMIRLQVQHRLCCRSYFYSTATASLVKTNDWRGQGPSSDGARSCGGAEDEVPEAYHKPPQTLEEPHLIHHINCVRVASTTN
ncbi:hypothetical protein E4U23_003541 [Claviceps purpurea]|nr:hypothetical protein E4U23_003541 [Claviceps purpurea]